MSGVGTYRPWPPSGAATVADPGEQLDLLALADPPRNAREREIYVASGAAFETDRCAAGRHVDCTGTVHVDSGDTLHSHVSASSGPCRCECHR